MVYPEALKVQKLSILNNCFLLNKLKSCWRSKVIRPYIKRKYEL